MGINSKMQIHARIVWWGRRPRPRDIIAQEKAPRTPAVVAITLMRPKASGFMCNWVFAYSTAVPETVAIASDRRNQATKKSVISLSRRASLTVRQSDIQA